MATTRGLVDRCKWNATSSGTGSFVYASALTGFRGPTAAGALDGLAYGYVAESSDHSEWETGLGVWTSSSGTLARTTISAGSNGTSAVSFTAPPIVRIAELAADFRIKFTADTTFHIATTGSDTTGDGTSGNPWATPQKAWDYVTAHYDFNNYDCIIQCADGTYTDSGSDAIEVYLDVYKTTWVGGGMFEFRGNLADRTAVRWSVNYSNIGNIISFVNQTNPAIVKFNHIQLVMNNNSGSVVFIEGVGQYDFDSCDIAGGFCHYDCSNSIDGQTVQIGGDYSVIEANPGVHINCGGGSFVAWTPNVFDANGSGTVTWQESTVFIGFHGVIQAFIGSVTGTFVGTQFLLGPHTLIDSYMTPANFPGDSPGRMAGSASYRFFDTDELSRTSCAFELMTAPWYNYQSVSTNASVTLAYWDTWLVIDPTTNLASYTVVTPAVPVNGHLLDIRTSKAITAFVLSANVGQTVIGAPSALSAGQGVTAIYNIDTTKWYCR